MISHLIVSLIVALIAIAFDSTYVDQDDLPVVTSGISQDSGSRLCAESSWDRVALTDSSYVDLGQPTGVRDFSGEEVFPGVESSRRLGITSRL